jgi:hypothetical protein
VPPSLGTHQTSYWAARGEWNNSILIRHKRELVTLKCHVWASISLQLLNIKMMMIIIHCKVFNKSNPRIITYSITQVSAVRFKMDLTLPLIMEQLNEPTNISTGQDKIKNNVTYTLAKTKWALANKLLNEICAIQQNQYWHEFYQI